MDRFSDAGASHTAKSPLRNSAITFCEIKIRPIVLNTNKTTLIIVFVLSDPSRRSKPRNPVLRPAVQCFGWGSELILRTRKIVGSN